MLRALPRDQTKEHRGARDSFADRCQREPALSCRAGIAPDRGDGGDLHDAVKGETINRMDANAARLDMAGKEDQSAPRAHGKGCERHEGAHEGRESGRLQL